MNPHERNVHTDLNRARLPIPPFLRAMREMGLEPTRLYRHKILSLACLPIPALPLVVPQVVYYHLICIKSIQNLKNFILLLIQHNMMLSLTAIFINGYKSNLTLNIYLSTQRIHSRYRHLKTAFSGINHFR